MHYYDDLFFGNSIYNVTFPQKYFKSEKKKTHIKSNSAEGLLIESNSCLSFPPHPRLLFCY